MVKPSADLSSNFMISLVATFPLCKTPPIQDKVNLIREFSSVCGEVLVLHMDDRFRLLVSPAITLLLLLSVKLVTGRILIRLPFRTGQSETKTRGGGDLATRVCTRGYIQSQSSLEWKFGQRAFCTSTSYSTQQDNFVASATITLLLDQFHSTRPTRWGSAISQLF